METRSMGWTRSLPRPRQRRSYPPATRCIRWSRMGSVMTAGWELCSACVRLGMTAPTVGHAGWRTMTDWTTRVPVTISTRMAHSTSR